MYIPKDLKRSSPVSSNGSENRCATLKASGILPGRLLNVPLPNPNSIHAAQQAIADRVNVEPFPTNNRKSSKFPNGKGNLDTDGLSHSDDSAGHTHGSSGDAYHWDCSDWVRRSHNPLPNITEVPGSEVPDSSSFHSNESNESQCKQSLLTQSEFIGIFKSVNPNIALLQ